MGHSAFTAFQQSREAKRAKEKYNDTDFAFVIEQARNSDADARNYLILMSMPALISSFIKGYVRGQHRDKDTINDMSYDFFNTFIALWIKNYSKGKGPIFSFNPKVFSDQSSDFLFNKFRYYMYTTGMAAVNYMKRHDSDDIPVSSIENVKNSEDYTDMISNIPDPMPTKADQMASQTTYADFEAYLKKNASNKKLLVAYSYLKQDYTVKDIAEEMGVSHQYVYTITKKLASLYQGYRKEAS